MEQSYALICIGHVNKGTNKIPYSTFFPGIEQYDPAVIPVGVTGRHREWEYAK